MRLTLLALFAVLLSFEAFAQGRRGGRIDRNDRYDRDRYDRPRGDIRIGIGIDAGRGRGTIVVGPRYHYGNRRIRLQNRRMYYYDNRVFGHTCDYGTLRLNGRRIHDFYNRYDCVDALRDIRNYGDYCDGADMYDERGFREASFASSYDCRDALGWY